jgi:hypothetical protein
LKPSIVSFAFGAALLLTSMAAAQTAAPASTVAPAAKSAPAAAATAIPDLKGTWVGKGEAIVDGPAGHHPPGVTAKPASTYRLREETFTVRIEGQEGKRVWGTVASSQRVAERLIGSVAADGKTVYFVTGEGYIDGVVINANTMDVCYRHVLPGSAVVACNQWVRQK